MMNNSEPTEHEKQIAKEAADELWKAVLHARKYDPNGMCDESALPEFNRVILAAITAAKQEQNEDTVRLDWVQVNVNGQGTSIGINSAREFLIWSHGREQKYADKDIRAAIDASRGVQSAAKVGDTITVEGDYSGPITSRTITTSAAKQESAPAAEQQCEVYERVFNLAPSPSAETLTPRELPSQETGSGLIAIERARQISQEGWTPEHDDEHTGGTLAVAGAAYALQVASRLTDQLWWGPEFTRLAQHVWQWDQEWWKPSDNPVRDLTKAGALIAAEIDRLLRECSLSPDVTTPSGISVEAKPESESVAAQEESVEASGRIDIPTVEGLWSYLNYQFPATCGNIPLREFCAALASASSPSAEAKT